jgi:hypothetical protein
VLVLLIALPLLLVGAGLWTALSHRAADGTFAARLDAVAADGYAVVIPDMDALLKRDAAFARGGRTRLTITADTPQGPAFVGLAPADAVGRYLAGVPYTQLTEVKLTHGPLPVRLVPVEGTAQPPAPPAGQPFWLATSIATAPANTIEWVPSAVRGQHLALVVMNPDGRAKVAVALRAAVTAGWLPSTTWGVLVLGAFLLVLALVVLCWPDRPREVVYVMEPSATPPTSYELPVVAKPPADRPAVPVGARKPPVTLRLDWPPGPSSREGAPLA